MSGRALTPGRVSVPDARPGRTLVMPGRTHFMPVPCRALAHLMRSLTQMMPGPGRALFSGPRTRDAGPLMIPGLVQTRT